MSNPKKGAVTKQNVTEVAKRKRRHRKRPPQFDTIDGVQRVRIPQSLQKELGVIVGTQVTVEKPWAYVKKELIVEDLEFHEDSSTFLDLKPKILSYPRTDMLVGYIPDDDRFDEFYICVTETATETVDGIIKKQQESQQKRLNNAVFRNIKHWRSQGSEEEMEDLILKTGRNLLEMEVETKYPILPFNVEFRFRKTENVRDGYMELTTEAVFNNVSRRRTDAGIQQAAFTSEESTQTIFFEAVNDATQYEYVLPEEIIITPEFLLSLNRYIEQNMDTLSDLMHINMKICPYVNDYAELAKKQLIILMTNYYVSREYYSFLDVHLCKDKMISSACWHPQLTGIVAISYTDMSQMLYYKTKHYSDDVAKAVHERNLVLIWSTNNSLIPKLVLETPREVTCVSICPFDENIVVGGCANGQVIIWDIEHRIDKVEEEIIMTEAEMSYRTYLKSLMSWMKDIYNIASVRVTALSDLEYSHKDAIVNIDWISPRSELTKTGKVTGFDDTRSLSCQFLTACEDGSVGVWSLHSKPILQPGGFKPQRKLKRLKERPAALLESESHLKAFHMNLKPIFMVQVHGTNESMIPAPIMSFCCDKPPLCYELPDTDLLKRPFTTRLKYKCTPVVSDDYVPNRFTVGTLSGEFLSVKFDGVDFDSGQVVNSEFGYIKAKAVVHDGPITTIRTNPTEELILTCGGKIVALWMKDHTEWPVFWRKSATLNTFADFSFLKPSYIMVGCADGQVEIWAPHFVSKKCVEKQTKSSQSITGLYPQERRAKQYLYGMADSFGTFRLFKCSYGNLLDSQQIRREQRGLPKFLRREYSRKSKFLEWQKRWNKRYGKPKEEIQLPPATAEEKTAVDDGRKLGRRPSIPYIEYVKREREKFERENVNRMITEKKKMNMDVINAQRRPLLILEAEREKKKKKQRERLINSENIFQETVAMLFPEVLDSTGERRVSNYEPVDDLKEKRACYKRYMDLYKDSAARTVARNPFNYQVNQKAIIAATKSKRDLEVQHHKKMNLHRLRHLFERKEREDTESVNVKMLQKHPMGSEMRIAEDDEVSSSD